jgi:hypothetical protein
MSIAQGAGLNRNNDFETLHYGHCGKHKRSINDSGSRGYTRGLAVVFGIRLPRALAVAFIDQALKASEGVAGLSAAMRGLSAARAAVMTAVAAIRRAVNHRRYIYTRFAINC